MTVTAEDVMDRMKLLVAGCDGENYEEQADVLEEKIASWGFDTESIFELGNQVTMHHLITSGFDVRQALLSAFNSGFIMGAAGMQEIETRKIAGSE